jgi:predicted esterase
LVLGALMACGSNTASSPGQDDDGGTEDAATDGPVNPTDGGTSEADAPTADAPPAPAALAVRCADAVDDVYVTPPGLPPMSLDHRGDVVRCASDQGYTVAEAQSALDGQSVAVTATSGALVYRILFRTTRGNGSPGVSSARVYLPTVQRAPPLPLIAIGHPSDGIADNCAPSKDASSNRDLALPWAALGYAVIVPDYAGFGTDGVQAYLDNHDQAYSLLDGARALRKMLVEGALSEQIVLFGYSQGGGAALSGQALAKDYGADGTIAAVVAIAPQWPTRMNSFGYVTMLEDPDGLTLSTGLSKSAIAVLREYAYFANRVRGASPGDGFPSANRDALDGAVTGLCLIPLGGYIQVFEPMLKDLIDDGLRTSLVACIKGEACEAPGADYYDFLTANVLHADPRGAPVLLVQGLADQIMLPAEEAACTIDKLKSEGVTPDVCTDPIATHTTVVARNVAHAIAWAQAKLAGTTPPSCSTEGMPACAP